MHSGEAVLIPPARILSNIFLLSFAVYGCGSDCDDYSFYCNSPVSLTVRIPMEATAFRVSGAGCEEQTASCAGSEIVDGKCNVEIFYAGVVGMCDLELDLDAQTIRGALEITYQEEQCCPFFEWNASSVDALQTAGVEIPSTMP